MHFILMVILASFNYKCYPFADLLRSVLSAVCSICLMFDFVNNDTVITTNVSNLKINIVVICLYTWMFMHWRIKYIMCICPELSDYFGFVFWVNVFFLFWVHSNWATLNTGLPGTSFFVKTHSWDATCHCRRSCSSSIGLESNRGLLEVL